MNDVTRSLRKRKQLLPSPDKARCYSCGQEVKADQMSRHLAHYSQCVVDLHSCSQLLPPANNCEPKRKKSNSAVHICHPQCVTLSPSHFEDVDINDPPSASSQLRGQSALSTLHSQLPTISNATSTLFMQQNCNDLLELLTMSCTKKLSSWTSMDQHPTK
jgi:hypothetical protein